MRNNWGPGWGDRGYFYITYGAANLGAITSFVDQWLGHGAAGALWHYDEGGWWQSWGCEDRTAFALARFRSPQDESISRLELWTTDATTDLAHPIDLCRAGNRLRCHQSAHRSPYEPGHYFTVRYIVENQRLPVASDEGLAQQEAAQASLYYLLSALIIAPLDTGQGGPG